MITNKPNLNALPVGTIVKLPKGFVKITDNLAAAEVVREHPLYGRIGYNSRVVKTKYKWWRKGDDVWFLPAAIRRVVRLPEEK